MGCRIRGLSAQNRPPTECTLTSAISVPPTIEVLVDCVLMRRVESTISVVVLDSDPIFVLQRSSRNRQVKTTLRLGYRNQMQCAYVVDRRSTLHCGKIRQRSIRLQKLSIIKNGLVCRGEYKRTASTRKIIFKAFNKRRKLPLDRDQCMYRPSWIGTYRK